MKNLDSILFSEAELETIDLLSSQILPKPKRITRQHARFIRENKKLIESFFDRPRVLQIETIAKCNAKCPFCPTPRIKRKRSVIPDQLFQKIVRDCKELKPRMIWPFLNGEPFLDKKILERIDYINRVIPDQRLGLFTNASLLTESKIKRFFDYNIALLHVSINAASEDTYQKIMGLSYKRLLENMELILKYKRDALIEVSFVVCEENKDEVDDFRTKWSNRVDRIGVRGLGSWSGQIISGDTGLKEAYRKIRRRLKGIILPYGPCTWQIMNVFVLSNGKVCHCCGDSEGIFTIGDANKETLFDIWHSDFNRKLRYKHLLGTHVRDIAICKNCRDLN